MISGSVVILRPRIGVSSIVHGQAPAPAAGLTIGGSLLVDDLEELDAAEPAFRRYLDEVAIPVVNAEGGGLFVGPRLRSMSDPAGCERMYEGVATFSPPAPATALVFGMNLAVLVDRGETAPRPDLAAALDDVASGRRAARRAIWRVRQVAWRRTPG